MARKQRHKTMRLVTPTVVAIAVLEDFRTG